MQIYQLQSLELMLFFCSMELQNDGGVSMKVDELLTWLLGLVLVELDLERVHVHVHDGIAMKKHWMAVVLHSGLNK